MTLFHLNRANSVAVGFFCLATTLGLSGVIAGPLAVTNLALNDGFGPDGGRWRGTATITSSVLGNTVIAQVDWAAFGKPAVGPGNFQFYLNSQSIAQVDPSDPLEVIYVYQITSVTSAIPGIDTLTVGVDAADARGTVTAPAFVPTGAATEQSPSSGGDNTSSMAWFFNGTELQAGDTSSLLVFTSPFAPELDFLQINSGLAGPIPSPLVASISDRIFQFTIPEPSTLILVLLFCVVLPIKARTSR